MTDKKQVKLVETLKISEILNLRDVHVPFAWRLGFNRPAEDIEVVIVEDEGGYPQETAVVLEELRSLKSLRFAWWKENIDLGDHDRKWSGVAVCPEHPIGVTTLMRHNDEDMYDLMIVLGFKPALVYED